MPSRACEAKVNHTHTFFLQAYAQIIALRCILCIHRLARCQPRVRAPTKKAGLKLDGRVLARVERAKDGVANGEAADGHPVAFHQDDLAVGGERAREGVSEDGVADEEVVRLVLREDACWEFVGVEDGGAERTERPGSVHLRGEGDACACEGQDLRCVTVHYTLNGRECFVDLREELMKDDGVNIKDCFTSECINRSRKPEGTAAPVTEELNVRERDVAF